MACPCSLSRKKSIALVVLILLAIATYFIYPVVSNNIHTVIPNKVYRSAELSDGKLNEVIKRYNIKTILNLRGSHVGELWYTFEVNSAEKNHIRFYNWSLPAHAMPTQAQLQNLITALGEAPLPILIHCKNGADRSGLVSALAVILYTGESFSQANEQISYKYLAFSPNSVGRLVMPKYEAWLKKNGLSSNAKNLKAWIYSKNPLG